MLLIVIGLLFVLVFSSTIEYCIELCSAAPRFESDIGYLGCARDEAAPRP